MDVLKLSEDKYRNSASIYKAHSEVFVDDLGYYLAFTKGHRTLDMFAGYGRVSNFLARNGVEVDAVELNPELARQIVLGKGKSYVGDVLTFSSEDKYSRIIAAYNSFCLITGNNQIQAFFDNLSRLLVVGGMASLSYYDINRWEDAVAYDFDHEGKTVKYIPSFDLSNRSKKSGVWIDQYSTNSNTFTHRYEVQVYEDAKDVMFFAEKSGFRLHSVVREFGNSSDKVMEPGWIDYVLEKVR